MYRSRFESEVGPSPAVRSALVVPTEIFISKDVVGSRPLLQSCVLHGLLPRALHCAGTSGCVMQSLPVEKSS